MLTHFVDAWNDPAMRHAMVVHFPIVLSIVGIPFAVGAALVKDKREAIRWAALAIYLALAVSAFVASNSGENAKDAVEGSLHDEAQALVHEHDELGEKVWPLATAVCALLCVGLVRNPKLRLPSTWLAVAGGLFVAGWVANTADHGGRLVYEYGAGTPDELAEILAATAASDPPTPDARVTHFRAQVRPILVNNCLRCHNPKRAERAGGLDLTTITGVVEGGDSGPALVPGRPQESLLIAAVRWVDPDLKMPRGEDKLTDDQIAALEAWIADGAVWERFEFEAATRMRE
jgi:uncharacterized membrane protein